MKRNLWILALLLVLQGCKITFNGAEVPTEASTFSVKTFVNNTTLAPPTISLDLSENFKDLMLKQSGLDLIAKNGDLRFEGTITTYKIEAIAIQSGDTPAQNKLVMTLKVKYTNPYQKNKSFETSFTRFETFNASEQLEDVEASLVTSIADQISQDIYNRAFVGDW